MAGNGKTLIGILATALAVAGLLVGWGVTYGMIVKDVNIGVQGNSKACKNDHRLTIIETRLERLPAMEEKLDTLIKFAAEKGHKDD